MKGCGLRVLPVCQHSIPIDSRDPIPVINERRKNKNVTTADVAMDNVAGVHSSSVGYVRVSVIDIYEGIEKPHLSNSDRLQ